MVERKDREEVFERNGGEWVHCVFKLNVIGKVNGERNCETTHFSVKSSHRSNEQSCVNDW